MLNRIFDAARPALMGLEPERAHEASLRALELGLYPRQRVADDPVLSQALWGRRFPNPLGIAAGYDKDARVPDAMLAMGMGFAEIGTVTPLPQTGNPRPRVFRLPNEKAVINRLGFNNAGHQAALARLEARTPANQTSIVGVNIGANKDSTDRVGDYVSGIEVFGKLASYFTVNVSSPNTPGLRDLQAPRQLEQLLTRVMAARDTLREDIDSDDPGTPVIVKLAPDVATEDLPAILACIDAHKVDGICVSNTTLTRPDTVTDEHRLESGGLSGAPLFELSTAMLARVYQLTDGAIPLVGVGGITSGATAVSKIEAGASLIQLYTGLIYGGPGVIREIKDALCVAIGDAGVANISELVGRRADHWSGEAHAS